MRYTPVAVALSLLATVSSSVLYSRAPDTLDPRAETLLGEGRAAVASGNYNAAIDAYEAALAVEPGSVAVLLGLAEATRREGLQGKALHYYRVALTADPRNLAALSGEGMALAEKGATAKANRNLARLRTLCGMECAETKTLAAAIAKGPSTHMVSAEAVTPKPVVSEN
ncbi:tetratricopeptide repeat protein [Novosphingobium mangrovi (ex Huang et al. 2023)]|uniref:Tetratricopeptide repeat protein n=1 Tax=Novosphingobium mangrovi (ex Huang et al. 2023) TaxID=2976432 RepID=A0ABT2I793_9SPHN|nr:tetratricopeptide repeat protein [Novosphingobium mangrovi (ex Huang et al. 2023)]MCT2400685.1 tetratricopeptide repeat protein [Novosphingobium mangrovi (ex Huang et al. 2023)]